ELRPPDEVAFERKGLREPLRIVDLDDVVEPGPVRARREALDETRIAAERGALAVEMLGADPIRLDDERAAFEASAGMPEQRRAARRRPSHDDQTLGIVLLETDRDIVAAPR